jgi:hypothetical protein
VKVVDLTKTGARDPRECLRALLADIDAGKVTISNAVIVTASETDGIEVRGTGVDMGTAVAAIGMLHLGIAFLVAVCTEDE